MRQRQIKENVGPTGSERARGGEVLGGFGEKVGPAQRLRHLQAKLEFFVVRKPEISQCRKRLRRANVRIQLRCQAGKARRYLQVQIFGSKFGGSLHVQRGCGGLTQARLDRGSQAKERDTAWFVEWGSNTVQCRCRFFVTVRAREVNRSLHRIWRGLRGRGLGKANLQQQQRAQCLQEQGHMGKHNNIAATRTLRVYANV